MITARNKKKFADLFEKYDELDIEQQELYLGKIILPIENKEKFNSLQIKKISILEEMGKCYENTRSNAISLQLV